MKKLWGILVVFLLIGCAREEATIEVKETELEEEVIVEEEPEPVINEYEVKFIAGGDNLIHTPIVYSSRVDDGYDFKPIYSKMKEYLSDYDLRFINQETPLGGVELGISGYPRFNSPVEVGDAIIDAGFNLISLANNHSLDKKETGIINTLAYFEDKDVYIDGMNNEDDEVTIFEMNGIKFAFLAYTNFTNGLSLAEENNYMYNLYNPLTIKEEIVSIQDEVDFIIVSLHWGVEYQDYEQDYQVEQALYLAELGVDMLVGNHPHVIEPIDKIVNTKGEEMYVTYSLGNFLSNQDSYDKKMGALFEITFNKIEVDGEVTELSLSNPEAHILYHYRDSEGYNIVPLVESELSIKDELFTEKADLLNAYLKTLPIN